jgi:hypothetical protein
MAEDLPRKVDQKEEKGFFPMVVPGEEFYKKSKQYALTTINKV